VVKCRVTGSGSGGGGWPATKGCGTIRITFNNTLAE
jgi:hypothetical protein